MKTYDTVKALAKEDDNLGWFFVLRWAKAYANSQHEFDDLAQGAIIDILENRHKFDPTRGVPVERWYGLIAKNYCHRTTRKEAPWTVEYVEMAVDTQEPLFDKLDSDKFTREYCNAVESLPPVQRLIWKAHVELGIQQQEIAKKRKVSKQAVQQKYQAARRRLMQLLSNWEEVIAA